MEKKEGDTPKKVEIDLIIPILPAVLVVQGEKSSKAGYTKSYEKGYGGIKWEAQPSAN